MTRRAALVTGAGVIGAAVLGSAEAKADGKVPASMVQAVRDHAIAITGEATDYATILNGARSADFVLLGEASHGTHEFYETRAKLTRRLIEEQGFNGVIVEANWPEAYRVNQYVLGVGADETAEQSLSSFDEYPQWMWRNTAVRDFVEWLRGWNLARPEGATRTRFHGMDLYSLYGSRDAVIEYAAGLGEDEANKARDRYAALGRSDEDPQVYARSAAFGGRSAAGGAKDQFEHLTDATAVVRESSDANAAEAAFNALQNARVVKNGEEYYRQMYDGRVNTWNLRDRHMVDTIDAVAEHLRRRDGYARIVIWAHNSHLGDARATESKRRGEWNVGQLVRERHPEKSLLVGFSTSTGTVMASSDWGGEGVVKQVRKPLPGSYERVFHESGVPAFVLPLHAEGIEKQFEKRLLERAIGVIYRPDTERWSHYFEAEMSKQFDVVIHFEETRAVEPLDRDLRSQALDVNAA